MRFSTKYQRKIFLSLVAFVISLMLCSQFPRYPDNGGLVYASLNTANNTMLYLDCWHSEDTVSIEARPVTPNSHYTAMFIDFTVYTMFYTNDSDTGKSNVFEDGNGVFRSLFDVPEKIKTKNMYIAMLFNGSNIDNPPVAQGTGMCSDEEGGINTVSIQNLERQCQAFANKHKEVNGIILASSMCKPMKIK